MSLAAGSHNPVNGGIAARQETVFLATATSAESFSFRGRVNAQAFELIQTSARIGLKWRLAHQIHRDRIEIVLVSPRNPLNIGAAARAMANFGFARLAVVAPYEAHWREAKSAVGASDLLQSAKSDRSLPTPSPIALSSRHWLA